MESLNVDVISKIEADIADIDSRIETVNRMLQIKKKELQIEQVGHTSLKSHRENLAGPSDGKERRRVDEELAVYEHNIDNLNYEVGVSERELHTLLQDKRDAQNNLNEAKEKKASLELKLNDSMSRNEQGILYENEPEREIEWLEKALENRNAEALPKVIEFYEKNDPQKAIEWYFKAAGYGIAHAQCKLGDMYLNGKGVSQSMAAAVKWYTRAAELGNEEAKTALDAMAQSNK